MPAPLAAAAVIPQVIAAGKKIGDFPVIGIKTTTVKVRKSKTVITEKNFQLRGWELGAGLIGLGALLAGTYVAGMWRWKAYEFETVEKVYTGEVPGGYYMGKRKRVVNLPSATNTDNWWGGLSADAKAVEAVTNPDNPFNGIWWILGRLKP